MQPSLPVSIFSVALLASLTIASQTAHAQIDLTNGATVIAESGDWGTEHNDFSRFQAQYTIDNNVTEPIGAGGSGNTMWLGREMVLGENFTIDLAQSAVLSQINLYNTHNGQFNDRSTGDFHIDGSNSVTGTTLNSPVTILTGTLSNVDDQSPIAPDVFAINNPASFRYLQFFSDTVLPGKGSVGLNEIEVISVPEPTALLALCGGVALLSSGWRARRAHRGA